MFAVDDIDDTIARLRPTAPNSSARWCATRTSSLLCYLRGPEGVIVALAEELS